MLKKNWATAALLACIFASGCSSHAGSWSCRDVTWFSCFVLVLLAFHVYTANRLTLQMAGPPQKSVGPLLCLSGLFFLVWGSKLDLIHSFGSSVPYWDQWGFEGPLYSAVVEGRLDLSALFASSNEHRPFVLRLLLATLFELNGQWDPIVTKVAASLLYSLILIGQCLIVWRIAGRRNLALFCIITGIIGVSHFSWESTLGGMHAGFYFLWGLSVLSFVLLLYSKPFAVTWLLGLVATLLAQLFEGSGFLAPLAIACVLILNGISRTQDFKRNSFAIAALIGVAILEFQFVYASSAALVRNFEVIGVLRAFARTAAFPFRLWPFAAIVWLPFALLIRNQFRTKKSSPLAQFLFALGTWSLLQSAVLAWSRGGGASRHSDLQAVGLLVNVIITFYLLASYGPLSKRPRSYRIAVWAGSAMLVLITANSVLHLKERPTLVSMHLHAGIQEVNTARYVLTGDPSALMGKPEYDIPVPAGSEKFLMGFLDDRTIRKILPACIRAPLPVEPAENTGFASGAIPPELPALPHRSVLGSWGASDGHTRCEYLSNPISSRFQWLVFDIAGGGPGTSFEILPSEGAPIKINRETQSNSWKKVVVETPRGPFRLHATGESGRDDGWIAFSLPRELAGGGYYVRRVLSWNLFVITFGMLALLGGLTILPKENPARESEGLNFQGIF